MLSINDQRRLKFKAGARARVERKGNGIHHFQRRHDFARGKNANGEFAVRQLGHAPSEDFGRAEDGVEVFREAAGEAPTLAPTAAFLTKERRSMVLSPVGFIAADAPALFLHGVV